MTSAMSCSARAADCRRANASRLRTILAARSDSSAMRRRSWASWSVPQFLLQELGVPDHARQRIVQLVRHAGDELSDGGELLRLQ
jgi:hypothetical protein